MTTALARIYKDLASAIYSDWQRKFAVESSEANKRHVETIFNSTHHPLIRPIIAMTETNTTRGGRKH